MPTPLEVLPFDLRSSPWLQRAVNEPFRAVWGYWGAVHGSFAPDKADVELRVAFVLEHNDHAALLRLAAEDRELSSGACGPPRDAESPDPLRMAAFRVIELATRQAMRDLRIASLEPAAQGDFVSEETPGLWELLSRRDSLLPINDLSWPSECKGNVPYFVVGDRAVYPHPFIIDNRELMGDVIALGLRGADAKIAIDPNRRTMRADACDQLLLDYWFGCKLTLETIDSVDQRHLGETWHLRPVNRASSLATHPVAATVFRWSADGHIKKLEVVEIAPGNSWAAQHGPYVVNRYLHSLRDTRLKRFTHVDGAVRAYKAEQYNPTQENPKSSCGEPVRYRKLFRVDGVIDDDAWGRIVAHYFRGNELVIEYFGELLDERGWAEPPEEPPTSTVPAAMN